MFSSPEANKILLFAKIAASIIAAILLIFVDIIRPPFNKFNSKMYNNYKLNYLLYSAAIKYPTYDKWDIYFIKVFF